MGVYWRIPANAVPSQPIRFAFLVAINDLAMCQINLSPSVDSITPGENPVDVNAAVVGGNMVTNPSGVPFEIVVEVSEANAGDLVAGDWIDFLLNRLAGGACPGVIVLGLAVEYEVR